MAIKLASSESQKEFTDWRVSFDAGIIMTRKFFACFYLMEMNASLTKLTMAITIELACIFT